MRSYQLYSDVICNIAIINIGYIVYDRILKEILHKWLLL